MDPEDWLNPPEVVVPCPPCDVKVTVLLSKETFEKLLTDRDDLLAACEQMVAALRDIRDYTGGGLSAVHGDALDAGLAAIAKARGE